MGKRPGRRARRDTQGRAGPAPSVPPLSAVGSGPHPGARPNGRCSTTGPTGLWNRTRRSLSTSVQGQDTQVYRRCRRAGDAHSLLGDTERGDEEPRPCLLIPARRDTEGQMDRA